MSFTDKGLDEAIKIAAGGTQDHPQHNKFNGSANGNDDVAAAFTFVGDAPAAAPRELIKGLLPAYGVAVTGGQSTAGQNLYPDSQIDLPRDCGAVLRAQDYRTSWHRLCRSRRARTYS